MDFPVFPIHKKLEYLKEACALINSEWKRSETARLRSFACSCDFLPVNLIMLKEKEVIGHAKLTNIPSMPKEACFVESVVIKQELRGQGYGSHLMGKVEEYCAKTLKLKVIYLSTKGQEKFYRKLGYTECKPVQLFGSPTVTTVKFESFKPIGKLNGAFPPPKELRTYMSKNINCTTDF